MSYSPASKVKKVDIYMNGIFIIHKLIVHRNSVDNKMSYKFIK